MNIEKVSSNQGDFFYAINFNLRKTTDNKLQIDLSLFE